MTKLHVGIRRFIEIASENRRVFECVPVTRFIQTRFQCRPLPSQERILRNRRFKRGTTKGMCVRADNIASSWIYVKIYACRNGLALKVTSSEINPTELDEVQYIKQIVTLLSFLRNFNQSIYPKGSFSRNKETLNGIKFCVK